MSISILLLGYKGYVGSALYKKLSKNFNYLVTGVDRQSCQELKPQKWDIVINCAMPSSRFSANKDPAVDYIQTVEKTSNFYYWLQFDKFIQISTVSARTQLDTVYGRHKLAAESIIDQSKHLIFRLTATYDDSMTKGVVYDLIHDNPIYVAPESYYSFAPLDYAVKFISQNLDRTGVFEVGGKMGAPVALDEICRDLKIERKFVSDYVDRQAVLDYDKNAPNSYGVVSYIKEKLIYKPFVPLENWHLYRTDEPGR